MSTVKAEIPGGFLDFGPEEYLARELMLNIIRCSFRSYGFYEIETSMVEFLSTLIGEDETSKNIFTIGNKNNKGEDLLALRFDLTVSFARYLAANPYDANTKTGIKLPFSRMGDGDVFRADTPGKGRYRKFRQFDIDIAGTRSMLADSEIIAIMYKTLKALGVGKFVVRINNRKILNALSELVGISAREGVSICDITKEMMRILDKVDKIGIDGVERELKAMPDSPYSPQPNLSDEAFLKVRQYLEIGGSNASKLKECIKLFEGISIAEEGIAELEEILGYIKVYGIPEDVVVVDFSVARGLDYYTGPVMEAIILDAPEFGSVFSGGRYDNLVERFTGKELPAVGASIGVDRLFAVLKHLGLINLSKKSVSDVMVLRLSNNYNDEYISIAEKIRNQGYNVKMCFLEDIGFKAQFNFALNSGIKYVVICGEDEISKNTLQIKDTETRNQIEIKKEEIESYFKKKGGT